ncbi:hypothetical protein [Pseudomonas canadensis]|uniref:hypothetical protein n=1 Tax=Pseudomonas canadensis TaxID=915099 RepID=UPI0027338D9D|nr:hypothetical protein [Pseudomonas canadensis]WLH29976.1 hypothetical protein PSH56_28805 [Pseudomonas canadensis]
MPLGDIVAVSGLLLTLTTFMFNLAWPKVHDALAMDENQSGAQARKRSRTKVINILLACALPMTSTFMALFYVNLPTAVRVMNSSTLDLWNFDVDRTLYVLVVLALRVFALFNAWLVVRLIDKWRKLG